VPARVFAAVSSGRPLALALVAAAALVVGCGESGRYHVSGRVTCGDQPVPAGTITFLPVGSDASQRGAGFCSIVSGSFSSRSGKSPFSGRQRVLVSGFDGIPFQSRVGDVVENNPLGKPLFPTHVEEIDIPRKHGAVFDFAVPKTP